MSDEALFHALRRAARRDEPPALEARAASALAREALEAARAEPVAETQEPLPPLPQRSALRPLAAALALAAAAAALLAVRAAPTTGPGKRAPSRAEAAPAPSQVETAVGDRVYAGARTRYSWEQSADTRGVHLQSGAVLCDVRRGAGQFVVRTPRLTVRVLGTVFSVSESERGAAVRVYEGRVAVTDARGREVAVLAAGQVYEEGEVRADAFAERGEALADARLPRPAEAHSERARARPRPDRAAPRHDAPRAPDLHAARRALADGDAERARQVAVRALASAPDADWRVLHGDALRALGRPADAVAEYESAARAAPRRGVTIGYRIAATRARDLRDPRGALEALDRFGVDGPGSRLAERGASLRIDASRAMGVDARAAVEGYLARFPDGPRAEALRAER